MVGRTMNRKTRYCFHRPAPHRSAICDSNPPAIVQQVSLCPKRPATVPELRVACSGLQLPHAVVEAIFPAIEMIEADHRTTSDGRSR